MSRDFTWDGRGLWEGGRGGGGGGGGGGQHVKVGFISRQFHLQVSFPAVYNTGEKTGAVCEWDYYELVLDKSYQAFPNVCIRTASNKCRGEKPWYKAKIGLQTKLFIS